jgi:hypothetical protein
VEFRECAEIAEKGAEKNSINHKDTKHTEEIKEAEKAGIFAFQQSI